MLLVLRSCAAETWGEGSPSADDKRKVRVLLDLNMKSRVNILILDVQRLSGCITCVNVLV